jgi:hypothetical protein
MLCIFSEKKLACLIHKQVRNYSLTTNTANGLAFAPYSLKG